MTRRQKLIGFLFRKIDRFGDYQMDHNWPQWSWVYTGWLCWLCRPLWAHTVIDDQCCNPAHRYCAYCGIGTPNQEVAP